MPLTIHEPNEIDLVIDRIHDRWFDVDAITYDSRKRVVAIPFWSPPSWRHPRNRETGEPEPFDELMLIHEADEPIVQDREKIGIYSFNDLDFVNGQVVIRADPNVRISCSVHRLHITVGLDGDEALG